MVFVTSVVREVHTEDILHIFPISHIVLSHVLFSFLSHIGIAHKPPRE